MGRVLLENLSRKYTERSVGKRSSREAENTKHQASLKHHHQCTIKESLTKLSPYSKHSARYKMITRKLAIFVGSCNVANRIVDNLEFREMLSALDNHYPVPGRGCIQKELDQIMIEL